MRMSFIFASLLRSHKGKTGHRVNQVKQMTGVTGKREEEEEEDDEEEETRMQEETRERERGRTERESGE